MDFQGVPIAVHTVAKKRAAKPGPADHRVSIVTFRCRPSYRDWLAEFAEEFRVTPTQLLDQGLECLAKQRGFKAPPKR